MSSLNPAVNTPARGYAVGPILHDKRYHKLLTAAKDRFLSVYSRLNFGWYIATQLANHKTPYPLVPSGRDMWVFQAYQMMRDPDNYFDDDIAMAYHMHQYIPGSPQLGKHLQALLLSYNGTTTPEKHMKSVAKVTGVPLNTVMAYEALFFNVIDRQEDGIYLAQEVYPNTRMVEMDEDYLKNSTHRDLLNRVAYNHRDIDMTAYIAGLGDHSHFRKIAASDDREAELTRHLMGNGLLFAHTSLLNQRSSGISRTTTLLAASRQSGASNEEPTLAGIVPAYSNAFQKAVAFSRGNMVKQLKTDEGTMTVDV